MDIVWTWIPLISVGPIKFGEPAEPILKKFKLIRKTEYDAPDSESYEFPVSENLLVVENHCIDSVSCYTTCLFKGINLIGLALHEIRKVLGQEDEIGEMLGEQIPIEYFDLGLQLWIEEGTTISATCYGLINED